MRRLLSSPGQSKCGAHMLDEEAKSAAPLQARRLDVTLIGDDDGLRLPKLLADIGITVPFVVFTASAELQTGFEAC